MRRLIPTLTALLLCSAVASAQTIVSVRLEGTVRNVFVPVFSGAFNGVQQDDTWTAQFEVVVPGTATGVGNSVDYTVVTSTATIQSVGGAEGLDATMNNSVRVEGGTTTTFNTFLSTASGLGLVSLISDSTSAIFASSNIVDLAGSYLGTDFSGNSGAATSAIAGGGQFLLRVDSLMIGPEPTIGSNYCMAAINSTGMAGLISASGSAVATDNDLTLQASQLPSLTFAFFIVSQAQNFVQNPGGSSGNLCLGGEIGRYVGPGQIQQSNLAGEASLTIDLTQIPQPSGFVSASMGEVWNFQAWFRDTGAAGATSNFTDGLEVTVQ